MPTTKPEYLVITARVVGGNGRPMVIEHYAGEPFATKREAVRSGFKMYESDDFFIGVLRGGKLHHCEDIEGTRCLHGDSLPEIAKSIGVPLVLLNPRSAAPASS